MKFLDLIMRAQKRFFCLRNELERYLIKILKILPVEVDQDQFFVLFAVSEQYGHALYKLFMVFKVILLRVSDLTYVT